MEEGRDLGVDLRWSKERQFRQVPVEREWTHVLDRSAFLLVRLEDLEERLVRVGVANEAVLDLVDVVDGVVELHRGAREVVVGRGDATDARRGCSCHSSCHLCAASWYELGGEEADGAGSCDGCRGGES